MLVMKSIGRSSLILKTFALSLLTCTCAAAGAVVGSIAGALKGHTNGSGLSCGFGIGAMTGAITAIQLIDLVISDEDPLSKVAVIMWSLVNEEIYMEFVNPALLKAYQWQVSTPETIFDEIPDIFEATNATRSGLSDNAIKDLPVCEFHDDERSTDHESSCVICLQELKEGEAVRLLPNCIHVFHVDCIDTWLTRQGTCPVCRHNV